MKGLTPKQQRIWDMKRPVEQGGEGKTRPQIAAELGISEPVVGKQISVIHKKLGIVLKRGQHERPENAVENANPKKAAALVDAMTEPGQEKLENIQRAMAEAGFPERVRTDVLRRIRVKYFGAITEIKNLKTSEILELLGKKIHLGLTYLDDKVMSEASARDIMLGISALVEKRNLLRGEPTQIVSDHERKKLHELAPLLLAEVQRRGLTVEGQVTAKEVTPA